LLTLIKTEKLFGNARFATTHDLRKKGLFGTEGVILGKRGSRFIKAAGTEHILVAAPTRSGKGVGIVIPNLLSWKGSTVVLDIKLENYQITSGYRQKMGQQVFLWAPGDKQGKTHRYNPLDIIDGGNKALRINDIQKIAAFLCPTPPKTDPMWSAEARNLFTAVVLYLIDTHKPITLGECNRFLKAYTKDEVAALVELHQKDLDPICIANFTNYINMGEKQRSGVMSTIAASLELMDNALVDSATSCSDFSFADLRIKPTTIYVGITPDNLARFAPLLNLFFQQCCDVLIAQLPDRSREPHHVLMLLDEFTSLGRMDIIKDGLAFFAGYHLRLMPIIQGPSQLEDVYGAAAKDSMIQNFMYRVVFAPNNNRDASEISESLGNKTVKTKSRSQNTFKYEQNSTTTSETSRALMLPQEIRQMDRKQSIILVEAMPAIKAMKVRYYEDREFTGRYFNIQSPAENIGPLPVNIPVRAVTKSDFVKETIPKPAAPDQQASTNNPLFADLNNLTNPSQTKSPSSPPAKRLSDQDIDVLVDKFWSTAAT
jgi:type IV secretion system protein VirD4